MDTWVDFALGIGVGAVAALALRPLLSYLRSIRRSGASGTSTGPVVPTAVALEGPGAVGEEAAQRGDLGPGSPVLTGSPEDGEPSPSSGPALTREAVGISRRIVEHLFLLGRFGPDDVGSPAATQRGIGKALGAEQSAVSKALGRLVAAEVVTVHRQHVRGGDRRVKVYGLTRRGELLAHELRARSATPGGSAAGSSNPPTWVARGPVRLSPEPTPTGPK
jgi:DNA-binding MarR family transcriptional regulator